MSTTETPQQTNEQQNTQIQSPKILTEEEIKIQSFIDSLQLPFPFKWELEYHEMLVKGSKSNPVIPLLVISVDKMLSNEERAMIPSTFENQIRIQMEYVMTLDPNDESVKKELELEQQQAATAAAQDSNMDNDEEFEEFDDEESDDEEEM